MGPFCDTPRVSLAERLQTPSNPDSLRRFRRKFALIIVILFVIHLGFYVI